MCAKHDERPPEGAKLFTGLLLDEPTARSIGVTSANTVLGPVDARRLGVTLVSESLMDVLPGAQYDYDIKIDRAEVFDVLAAKLTEFKAAGGGTIVDAAGMSQEFAFEIGGEYKPAVLTSAHLAPLARQLGMRPQFLAQQAADLARKMPDAMDRAVKDVNLALPHSGKILAERLQQFVLSTTKNLAARRAQ